MVKVNSSDEFQEKLTNLNAELAPLDRVTSLERQGNTEELQAAIAEIGSEVLVQLREVANERNALVQDNSTLHILASADNPESPTYKHLAAHLHGDEFGSVFTQSEAFSDAHQIIAFSEQYLQQAYRGEMQPGQTLETTLNGQSCVIRFLPSNELADGVNVGLSAPGKRVVIEVQFTGTIGKDAVVSLEGKSSAFETRTMGGRPNEGIHIVEGNAPETQKMYIMGGAYGPTGKFGLYTAFPGTYAPPMADKEYWSRHGFYRN